MTDQQMTGQQMTGTIKKIVEGKPFGFITPSTGGDDVFFHESSLQGVTLSELKEGVSVTFEVEQSEKGPRAMNVAVVPMAA